MESQKMANEEIVPVYDKDGCFIEFRPRSKGVGSGEYHASGAVIIRSYDNVLVLKRSASKANWPLAYDTFSGIISREDIHSGANFNAMIRECIKGAWREFGEESDGLKLDRSAMELCNAQKISPNDGFNTFGVVIVVKVQHMMLWDDIVNHSDWSDIQWISLKELKALASDESVPFKPDFRRMITHLMQ
jgi:isopentenyldiphosphate isomerase